MRPIISHPGKPLVVHLREVARLARQTAAHWHIAGPLDTVHLQHLAFIQGAVHDIGKATRNFQRYIYSGGAELIRPKHHALISAFVARELAAQYLSDSGVVEPLRSMLPYFVFTAVKRHHGHLLDWKEELETLSEKREDLEILVDNFYDEQVQQILEEVLSEIGLRYCWRDFKEKMKDLEEVLSTYAEVVYDLLLEDFGALPQAEQAGYFYLHQLLFSVLLYADKTEVKLGDNKQERSSDFNFAAIEQYRQRKGFHQASSEINRLKNQAYFDGLQALRDHFDPQQHLYSITLPTGLGKTITSLAIAMQLKQLLPAQNPRIIITIPFTSIIDQNYAVFDDIFQSPPSSILLKHHHLAEPHYKLKEDEVGAMGKKMDHPFLIETWQSEVVVTTFVQLLEGLFTNHKGKLLKFPNLANAIILLDEIQQIKYELWPLIRLAFKVLAQQLNCYFVLLSATQPLIFDPRREIKELIPNYQQYFRFFNRTQLVNCTATLISLHNFVERLIAYHGQYPKKNLLVILNTKKETRSCFEQLREHLPEDSAQLYFLSTLITPYERKRIIERIKNSDTSRPNIIVSTQLIEAGVDLSVQTVFRAMAPLDAIIQAAGRANRYAESETPSEVYLYRIEELERATALIYGSDLMLKTHNVLKGIDRITERNYLQLIEAYFAEVKLQADAIHSKELAHLLQLNFAQLGQFSFIEERRTESVFLQLNEQAQAYWEQYVQIYSHPTYPPFEKRRRFAQFKASFYDYVINVPIPHDREHIDFDGEPDYHFYLSQLTSPSACYAYREGDFRYNTGYQAAQTLIF
ncbi:MAG: CRISPR-associated helicase Cas3' [Bacteroidota bacterium]